MKFLFLLLTWEWKFAEQPKEPVIQPPIFKTNPVLKAVEKKTTTATIYYDQRNKSYYKIECRSGQCFKIPVK